ncbi:MAG: hypothetical protein EP344_09425 [Bacteroidetes bacterium]|nr:MAG: hypothetical protein EP344_09425 [Bacteroidota bacterium]
MYKLRFTLLALGLLWGTGALAQKGEEAFCGYSGNSAWLDWYQRNTGIFNSAEGSDTSWLYVPVTVHLVGTDAGMGHFKFGQAIEAICDMNSQYEQARIRFYLMPGDAVRYYNNSSWYSHDWDGGSQMINSVLPGLQDRLNAFVVSDPAGNCGYSWQDAIVLKKGCSNNGNTTWAHEAGHHFSLPHPFRGWEGFEWDYSDPAPTKVNGREVERTDGSNCYVGGDRFCDTEPDYLTDRWPCNNDKRSTILQHDPDNISFRSDGTLIMGYAFDACASRFTTEQIDAVRANLKTEHVQYLQLSEPLTEIDDADQVELISPVDTSETVQYNHIELKWNPVPNALYYTVEVSNSPYFSNKFFYETLIGETSVTITKGIPNNWKLYWRVHANNDWDLCQPYDNAQVGVFRTQNLSATNDLERSAIITLMPNPVYGGMPAYLEVESDKAMDISISVNDASGRLCYRQQLNLYPGENEHAIPTNNLEAGLYTVWIQNEMGATVKRLVVLE